MTRSRKTQPKRGVDTAWQSLAQGLQLPAEVAGLFRRALEHHAAMYAELVETENAVASGHGLAEVVVSGGGHGQGAAGYLWLSPEDSDDNQVMVADLLAKQLRRRNLNAIGRLRTHVESLEVDRGLRAPRKGPRDSQGRLRIVAASYVSETPRATRRSGSTQEPASSQVKGQMGDRG